MHYTPAASSKQGISFCIPNWNHKNYLPRALASLRKAAEILTNHGIGCEVIVIDDGSRDGSQRFLVALSLLYEFMRVIINCENVGLAAVRNIGANAAQFDLICFLDADNEIEPSNILAFVQAQADTGATAVYGSLIKYSGGRSTDIISNDYIQQDIYEDNYIDATALYSKSALIDHGGFAVGMASNEDWEMWLHLIAEQESIVFVPMIFGYYYVNRYSMVQTGEGFRHQAMHRIYNQRQVGLPRRCRRRRMYLPGVGWLA